MSAPKAVRVKKGKIENELEKLRSECCWGKAIDLISPHKSDSALSYLYFLVLCESKLENFELNYLSDDDLDFAERSLSEAIKTPDEGYMLESSILYGKILYLRKNFTEAVKFLRKLNVSSIRIDIFNTRFARIVSEGLAVIGLCIEELAQMTRRPLSNEEKAEVLTCFQHSCELAIRHFQDLYQSNTDLPTTVSFPKVVFTAVQHMFVIFQQSSDVRELVEQFRHLLRYTETPSTKSLRQWLAFQLAELLLRGLCPTTYVKHNLSREKDGSLKRYVLPHRYPFPRFVPGSQYEEAVLLLLISEQIANQEVILNRPTGASDLHIKESFNNTSAVYDLLTIALASTRDFDFLSQTLEKSLKFSYREFHIWFQFALSLISAGKYYRAYLILRECLRLNTNKLSVLLLATSLCFGHLNFVDEGMEMAQQAVEVASSQNDSIMCARAHLMLGWGYSLLSRKSKVNRKRAELQNQAIEEYKTATHIDPDDHIAWYHLGVELATQRHLEDALGACHNSLRLMPTHSNTLCLLALLHTAGRKRMDQASKVLRVGLADRPNDFSLLFLLAKLEAIRQSPKAGLLIYRRLLEAWRDVFAPDSSPNFLDRIPEPQDVSGGTISGSEDVVPSLSAAVTSKFGIEEECTLPISLPFDNHLASVLSNMADQRVAQSGTSILPTNSNSSALLKIQAKIYHGLAELYLENGQLCEAKDALDEAVKLIGLDTQTIYLRGCLAERQSQVARARSAYESVIAIQPEHLNSYLSLAELLCQTNQATLAERVVRDAMTIDPTSCQVWKLLAKVLTLPNSSEPASDGAVAKALMNAIELEQTEPLEPFHQLPLGIVRYY